MSHATATKTGTRAENTVAIMLERVGYVDAQAYFTKQEYKELCLRGLLDGNYKNKLLRIKDKIEAPFFVRQPLVMSTVYDAPWRIDFVAYHPDIYKEGVCIECKTQTVPGSVDEKYVFVERSLLNVSRINNCETIFVLLGGVVRQQVCDYLERSSKQHPEFQFVSTEGALKKALERRKTITGQQGLGI